MANNPNTPVEILENLGEEFPDEITANPIFNLLLLENPESKFVLLSLARASTTSEEKLNELANHQDNNIREAIVNNSKTSANILDNMILKKLVTDTDYLVRQAIAEHPNVTIEILDKLKSDENVNVREQVAKNPNISLVIMKYLTKDSVAIVRQAVANNSQTSTTILYKLKSDRSPSVRQAIAQNPNTHLDVIHKLASDANKIVRAAAKDNLANNKK